MPISELYRVEEKRVSSEQHSFWCRSYLFGEAFMAQENGFIDCLSCVCRLVNDRSMIGYYRMS